VQRNVERIIMERSEFARGVHKGFHGD